ncbi:MAG: S1 family peptidase, partial [Planctomycetota bacterium]
MMRLIALAVLIALQTPLPAQEPERAEESVPEAAPEKIDEGEAIRKAYEAARPSIVTLEIMLRKKTPRELQDLDQETLDQLARTLINFAESNYPLKTFGVCIDGDGHVLIRDYHIRPDDIEEAKATDWKGNECAATLAALGTNYNYAVLKLDKPSADLKPLEFKDFEPFELGSHFHVVYVDRVDENPHINVSPYIVTDAPTADEKGWRLLDEMRIGAVVADEKGRPVGITTDDYLWTTPEGQDSFVGAGILADTRIPMDDVENRKAGLRGRVGPAVGRFEVIFRPESEEESPGYGRQDERVKVFGLPIDDKGTFLVPTNLSPEWSRRIKEILLMQGRARTPAKFVGLFEKFHALLVQVEGLETKSAIDPDGARPAPASLLFTAAFEERFGRARVRIDYNRFCRTGTGLAGKKRWVPRKPVRVGTFLMRPDGTVIGFYSGDKKEETLQEAAMAAARRRYGGTHEVSVPEFLKHPFFFGEMKEIFADPTAHFDPRAVPKSVKEEKQPVWLGVEYQELDKDLAELLEIQEREQTDDGRRGLLVTTIYPGSPAAKLGLKPDDVLLSVHAEGKDEATDLTPERGGYYGRPYWRERRGYGASAPWKPAQNYLNSLLTEIGAGKKVTLAYLRGGKRLDASLELEKAPANFDTAGKHKDEDL